MKKIFLFVASFIFVFCIKSETVFAQEIPVTQKNFDYDWYLEQHPDVAAAFGYDTAAIWNFYTTLGEPSGWYGRPSVSSLVGHYSDETLGILYYEADTICANYSSLKDRALAAHDWLCSYIDYDYTYSSYSIDTALLNRAAVCQGYAETYNLLAELCGIKSELVTGDVNNGYSIGGHAWNKLTINNEESYVDTTWDDFTDDHNYIAHDCFMITKERMDWIHDGKIFHFFNGQPMGYQ